MTEIRHFLIDMVLALACIDGVLAFAALWKYLGVLR